MTSFKISISYTTRVFSQNNYYVPQTKKKSLQSAISSRESGLWNNALPPSMKSTNYLPLFKKTSSKVSDQSQ